LISSNATKLCVIAYTVSEVSSGAPESWGTAEGKDRTSYYGWSSNLPGRIMGESRYPQNDPVNSIVQKDIDTFYAKPATFEITVTGKQVATSPGACSLYVEAKALKAFSSSLIMHVAIIETSVDLVAEYGSKSINNQSKISCMLRKMLPSGLGTVIGTQTVNKVNKYSELYTLNDVKQKVNYLNTRVVVFIQDSATKKIADAFISEVHPFQTVNIQKKPFVMNEKSMNIAVINGMAHFTLPNSGKYTITFYSLSGQIISSVSTSMLAGKNSYNLTDLGAGTLIMKVTGTHFVGAQKIVLN